MNASATFESEFLKLLFQNIGIANIGDATGIRPSTVARNVFIRLCTDAQPVNDSNIGTECAYTGYQAGGVPVPADFGDCAADPAVVWANGVDGLALYRSDGWAGVVGGDLLALR